VVIAANWRGGAPVNNRNTLAENTRLPDATTRLIATSAPTDTTGAGDRGAGSVLRRNTPSTRFAWSHVPASSPASSRWNHNTAERFAARATSDTPARQRATTNPATCSGSAGNTGTP
jgi:hypothetical protein